MVNVTSKAHLTDAAEDRWSGRLVRWLAVLVVANLLADLVIVAPLLVLPQMLQHFGTDQAALLNASAMLAGAMWVPLLGKSADIHGKRRVLGITLLVAGAGSLVCLVAPNIVVFVFGRFLQGAGVAAVFLTVALTRQVCAPRIAMTAVGIVTSGSAVLGIASPFLLGAAIDQFGYRSVFVVAAVLAVVGAVSVRLFVPEPPIRSGGTIDLVGGLLLGGGLAAVLGYVSLGPDLGWSNVGMLVLLVGGVAALVGGVVHAMRVDEPVVDLRTISTPLVLTLLAVVLAGGAFQSMLQLKSLVAQVSPELGLGYGLSNGGTNPVLFAAPALGVMIGGTLAGWLAGRIGPGRTLLGGIVIGTIATFGMLVGVSVLPVAIAVATLLGMATGATVTSGYNLATTIAPPEQHGAASGLVTVMLAIGSVVLNVAGAAVLKATATVGDGVTANSATGVHLYVLMAGSAFIAATALAIILVRRR
jgi:MFS family permease